MEIQILKCMHPRNMLTSTWAMYQSIAKSERVRVEVEKEDPILMVSVQAQVRMGISSWIRTLSILTQFFYW